MTREEAKQAVGKELRALKLTERLRPGEQALFIQRMFNQLQFRSNGDRWQDIAAWTDEWQAMWLRK
jgi:hypothetical protein